MVRVSAVIMASGFSRRMGRNKIFMDYLGQTFLEHTLTLVKSCAFFETILVIKKGDRHKIKIPKHVHVIYNDSAHLGQSATVKLGTKHATGEGYLFFPIDQPLLTKATIDELSCHYQSNNIVFPIRKTEKMCTPVYFGSRFREDLLNVSGESGGKSVKNKYKEAWCQISVSDETTLTDIDTLADYNCLVNRKHQSKYS